MPDSRPRPSQLAETAHRQRAEAAKRQHTKLTQTTILRIRRYGPQVLTDLEEGRVSVEHADQLLMAAGTLVRETAALDARAGGGEDAAGAAKLAVGAILDCVDAVEAGGEDAAEMALDALDAAGELVAACVALAVRAEEAAA